MTCIPSQPNVPCASVHVRILFLSVLDQLRLNMAHCIAQDAFLSSYGSQVRQNLYTLAKSIQPHLYVPTLRAYTANNCLSYRFQCALEEPRELWGVKHQLITPYSRNLSDLYSLLLIDSPLRLQHRASQYQQPLLHIWTTFVSAISLLWLF